MAVVLCSAMSKEGRGIFLTHFVMSHFMGHLLWPACKGGPIFFVACWNLWLEKCFRIYFYLRGASVIKAQYFHSIWGTDDFILRH